MVESETVGEVVHLPRVLRVVNLWKLEAWWTNLLWEFYLKPKYNHFHFGNVSVRCFFFFFLPILGLEKRTSGSSQMVPSLRRTAVAVV